MNTWRTHGLRMEENNGGGRDMGEGLFFFKIPTFKKKTHEKIQWKKNELRVQNSHMGGGTSKKKGF